MSKFVFNRYKEKSIVQKISFTGMFFALIILFQYLEKFMPFGGTFLKLNFSLLFILPIFYFAGPSFGIIAILLRFIIGPSIDGGYHIIKMVSHSILLISTSITIIFMYLYSMIFQKIKKHNIKIIFISILTVLSSSFILTVLNGLWFTPMYFYVLTDDHYGLKSIIDINGAKSAYAYVSSPFFFGIKNYWGGVFAVYFSGNLTKYGLVYLVYFPMSKIIKHIY